MILLWRTDRINDEDFEYLSSCWKIFAEKAHEEVRAAIWNVENVYKAWDAVNRTNGRYTVWARPEFVPHVSMWSELDYLRSRDVLLVSQKKYKCAFAPRLIRGGKECWDSPVMWEPDGIDGALVVFQLAGQNYVRLPPGHSVDIWEWIAMEQRCSYQVPQRYSGSSRRVWTARSILGETVYSPFSETPRGLPFTRERQYNTWHEMMDAWCIWLRMISSV